MNPRSSPGALRESTPEPAPAQEPSESTPEPAPAQEPSESTPEPAPAQEPPESTQESAPVQEPSESTQESAKSALSPTQPQSKPEPELWQSPQPTKHYTFPKHPPTLRWRSTLLSPAEARPSSKKSCICLQTPHLSLRVRGFVHSLRWTHPTQSNYRSDNMIVVAFINHQG